jgi:hypothetical protein
MPVWQPLDAQKPEVMHAGRVSLSYEHEPSVSGEQPSALASAKTSAVVTSPSEPVQPLPVVSYWESQPIEQQ